MAIGQSVLCLENVGASLTLIGDNSTGLSVKSCSMDPHLAPLWGT